MRIITLLLILAGAVGYAASPLPPAALPDSKTYLVVDLPPQPQDQDDEEEVRPMKIRRR